MIIIIIQIFIAYFVDDIKCHFAASMISGLVTTIASMPVDITKTRFIYIHIVIVYLFKSPNITVYGINLVTYHV